MKEMMMNLVREEEGQGMAEYGLILAGVAVAAIVAFKFLGGEVTQLINEIGTELTGDSPT